MNIFTKVGDLVDGAMQKIFYDVTLIDAEHLAKYDNNIFLPQLTKLQPDQ
jgi:hypothetical protein